MQEVNNLGFARMLVEKEHITQQKVIKEQVQSELIIEKQEQEQSNILEEVMVDLNDVETKVSLFRTKSREIHEQLWSTLLTIIKNGDHRNETQRKISFEMELNIFFLAFSTGLPIYIIISRMIYLNGKKEPYNRTTVSRCFDRTLKTLSTWAKDEIQFIDIDTWVTDSKKNLTSETFKKYEKTLFFYVDGSVVKTKNSSDPLYSRLIRNGKHSIPAFVFFIVVTTCGRIVYVSEELKEGSVHDKTHWENEEVCLKLEEKYGEFKGKVMINGQEYQLALCGDKAYPFMSISEKWLLFITKTGGETKDAITVNDEVIEIEPKAKHANLHHVQFAPGVAKLRSVVERVIRRVKKWAIFQSVDHMTSAERVRQLILISCAITNWMLIHSTGEDDRQI